MFVSHPKVLTLIRRNRYIMAITRITTKSFLTLLDIKMLTLTTLNRYQLYSTTSYHDYISTLFNYKKANDLWQRAITIKTQYQNRFHKYF